MDRGIRTAFEDMVFMDLARTNACVPLDEAQVYSRLQVQSPLPCLITLQMAPALVDACFDALYSGIESTQVARLDIVNELINIVSGLIMSHLSETSAIQLGLPEGGQGYPSATSGTAISCVFCADMATLQLTLTLP